MEIVEIWQNLEKNPSHIVIFLPHFMWAETKKTSKCQIDNAKRNFKVLVIEKTVLDDDILIQVRRTSQIYFVPKNILF